MCAMDGLASVPLHLCSHYFSRKSSGRRLDIRLLFAYNAPHARGRETTRGSAHRLGLTAVWFQRDSNLASGDWARLGALLDRLGQLEVHYAFADAVSRLRLEQALQQVVAESVAHAIEDGEDEELPHDLPDAAIPNGFKRCTGCREALPVTAVWFQRDSNLASGFRGRCKRCCSKKGAMTKKRERVVEDNGAEAPEQGDDASSGLLPRLTAPAVLRVTVPVAHSPVKRVAIDDAAPNAAVIAGNAGTEDGGATTDASVKKN